MDGAANADVLRTLASAFSCPKGALEIIKGLTSQDKTVAVAAPKEQLLAALQALPLLK